MSAISTAFALKHLLPFAAFLIALFCPSSSHARGNLHAVYDQTHGSLTWFASRLGGYGGVPGYRPLPLGHGAMVQEASAWRGKWSDITGLHFFGARYYDSVAGRFISYDPMWNMGDPSGYSAFAGNPHGYWDPNGMVSRGWLEGWHENQSLPANSSWAFDLGNAVGNLQSEYLGGMGRGAQNIGIGAWDITKGTVQAGWAFTGGAVGNLWEGEQTIYGAIGNNVANFATSAEARANTWNGISTYVGETFTDTDKFSQRIGGNGLITLLTLGAGEVAQGLRAGSVTAEGAGAAKRTPVFWSGGRAAEDAARTFANANNGIVIGDTAAGRALAQSTAGVPWSQARPQWLNLSENFARSASGEVNVFQNARGVAVDSIWRNEYQILRQNNVQINFNVVMPNGVVTPVP